MKTTLSQCIGVFCILVLAAGCKQDTPPESSNPLAKDEASADGETKSPAVVEKAATGNEAPGSLPTSVETATSTGLQKRVSPEGGYSVMAETKGTLQYSSTPTPMGPAKTTTAMYQKPGAQGALMVMYMDMPVKDGTPLNVEQGLEDGRDNAVAKYNGKLTADKRIEIDGNPAREFEFDATMPGAGTIHAIMRGAFRDKRIYMVGAVAMKNDAAYLAKGMDFVRSFSILPHVPGAEKK